MSCLFVATLICGGVAAAESQQPAGPSLGEPAEDQPQEELKLDSTDPSTADPSTDESASTEQSPPDEDAEAAPEKEPEAVGERLAAGMVELLQKEIFEGLKKRNIYTKFARFKSYAGGMLNATARSRGSELTGNCRLRWYDHLLRNPLKAPAEAEAFTRQLHEAVLDDHRGLDKTLAIVAAKLDLNPRQLRDFPEVTSPEQALEVVRQGLTDAQLAYCAALAGMSKSEIGDLSRNLYPILTAQCRTGHTLQSRGIGRRLCDLMELKLDRNAMHDAAEALVPITDPQLLEQLRSLPDDATATVEGVTGTMVRRIDTSGGGIVIGGKGKNVYQLDQMPGVNVVIDLGGDDVYYEGTVSLRRPVLIVIDLDGNDAYEGRKPGVQGAASMGVSMLLDFAGD
ncbi:MAG: hypothetical protein HQ567_26650, partial [Candidatus Nealsonbacteria bacterium]|nr:hypothetical protein [Candidatus Nealsonbacteria bacterium]